MEKTLSFMEDLPLMNATSYDQILRMAESLTRDEQLRLIHELVVAADRDSLREQVSVLELCGLGQKLWQQLDAQEYVRNERASWNG